MTNPPLPPGFVLEGQQDSSNPPLPAGFEMMQDDGIRDDGDGGLEIDIVGGRLEHPDGRLTEAGWEMERDRLRYQREAENSDNSIQKFLAGLYSSGIDTAQGAYQAAIDAMARPAVMGAVAGGDSFLGNAARSIADPLLAESERVRNAVAQRRREEEIFSGTLSGGAGEAVGTLGQVIGPGVLARGTAAAGALLPTGIRANALQGAALGAVQPVVSDMERAGNVALGGALGGAVPAAMRGASAIGGIGREVASRVGIPVSPGLSATDRRAADVLRSEMTGGDINLVESGVPGVSRTLGEATMDPGLMGLENTLRAQHRGAFDALDLRNNAARVSQLERIAGTDSDMTAATAARSDVVEGSLGRALDEGADAEAARVARVQADLQAARSAAAAAQAENARLASLNLPGRIPVPEVPVAAGVSDELVGLRASVSSMQAEHASRPSVQRAVTDVSRALERAGDSVSSLYGVRKYINDLLEGKAGSSKDYARAATRELMQLRSQLDDLIASRAPSFSEYLDAYRQASMPINRMDVGRQALTDSAGPIPDALGNPHLTPNKVMRATQDLDELAAKATGFKNARASEILTTEDIATIRAIQDDMVRQATRQKSAAAGSQTAERLSIGGRVAQQSIATRVPWAGKFFEHFEAKATERLTERLAYLMANPAEARRVLAALPKKEASAVSNALSQLAMAAGRSSPAISE